MWKKTLMIENDIIKKIKQISINSEHKFGFIAKYVIENAKKVSNFTIKQLADKTFSSPATINRFVHSISLEGYKEFVYVLRYYNCTYLKELNLQSEESTKKNIEKHFARSINDLTQTKEILLFQQDVIYEIAKELEKARKIHFFSVGGTYNVARDFSQKLQRLGLNANLSNDYHHGYYIVKQMKPQDVAFFISYSGETQEVIDLAKIAKQRHVKIISLTKKVNNTLSSLADWKLEIISDEPIKRIYSTTSRLTMLFALDLIYLSVLSFNPIQYLNLLNQTTIEKI